MKRPGGIARDFGPRAIGGLEAVYVEPKKPSIWRAVLRRLLGFLVVLVLVGLILVAGADAYVRAMAAGRTFTDAAKLPSGLPVLVFGTSPWVSSGEANRYFLARIEAAAKLYHEGKATFIIVSGDNEKDSYNEPRAMRKALVAKGVPGDKIVFDFAGFRTLDSVVRVKEVFRQNQVIFVSQEFQNQRAVCLARHYDIDARAFNAGGEASGLSWWRNWIRERLARVLMLLDLYLFDTEPKVLGPPEPVPSSKPAPGKR